MISSSAFNLLISQACINFNLPISFMKPDSFRFAKLICVYIRVQVHKFSELGTLLTCHVQLHVQSTCGRHDRRNTKLHVAGCVTAVLSGNVLTAHSKKRLVKKTPYCQV